MTANEAPSALYGIPLHLQFNQPKVQADRYAYRLMSFCLVHDMPISKKGMNAHSTLVPNAGTLTSEKAAMQLCHRSHGL